MKRDSISFVITEVQINIILRHYYTNIRKSEVKKTDRTK